MVHCPVSPTRAYDGVSTEHTKLREDIISRAFASVSIKYHGDFETRQHKAYPTPSAGCSWLDSAILESEQRAQHWLWYSVCVRIGSS